MKLIDLSYDEIMGLGEEEFYDKLADFFVSMNSNLQKQDLIKNFKDQGDVDSAKEKFTLSLQIAGDLA